MNYEYSLLKKKILKFAEQEIKNFIEENKVDDLFQFALTYDSENFGLYLSFNNKEQHELNRLKDIEDFDTINWKYDCFANIYLLDFKQIDILNEKMSYANDNQWIDFLENQTMNIGITLHKIKEMPFFKTIKKITFKSYIKKLKILPQKQKKDGKNYW
jgi:hypothetical protein